MFDERKRKHKEQLEASFWHYVGQSTSKKLYLNGDRNNEELDGVLDKKIATHDVTKPLVLLMHAKDNNEFKRPIEVLGWPGLELRVDDFMECFREMIWTVHLAKEGGLPGQMVRLVLISEMNNSPPQEVVDKTTVQDWRISVEFGSLLPDA